MSVPVSSTFKADAQALAPADFDRKSPFEKFPAARKLNDPRFGEIQVLQNPTSKEFVAAQELKFTDQKSAGAAVVSARQRLALQHPNLVKLLDYAVAKQSELCSTFFLVKLFYEYPKSDLRKESVDRERRGERFSAEELKQFFIQQSSALDYLHSKDKFHGDVQPILVGYNRDANDTRLIDRPELTSVDKLRASQKNRFVSGQPLYVSPATFAALASGNGNYEVDPVKEDSYGLGLTILELGNQRSVQDVYDKQSKQLNHQALENHLNDFHKSYATSPELFEAVVGLTSLDERNRVQSAQVTQFLVNGTNLHTIITTKVHALPMEGISLYDGIDTGLSNSAEPQREEVRVSAAFPAEEAPAEDSPKQLVHVEETAPTHYVYAAPVDDSSQVIYSNQPAGVTYQQGTVYSYVPQTAYYTVAPPQTVVYSSYPEAYTTTYVTDQTKVLASEATQPRASERIVKTVTPSEQIVYNQTFISTSPTIVSHNVTTQVSSNPTEITGLRLVRTYEDPTNARN